MTDATASPPERPARATLRWSAVVVLATLALGSVSLVYPFGRDQGIHAFIADQVLHGKVLYRDIFNMKPPLTTGVHALALLLFGHSMMAIRLLDLLWTVATSMVIFAFARRALGGPRVAALAAVLYSFQYYGCSFWTTAQTDGWLNLPLAAAFLLALPGSRVLASSRWAWMGAGACVGLAAAFKYTVILACPLLAVLIVLWGAGPLRQRLAAVGWLLTGAALVGASLGLLLAATGALPAFFESQFGLAPAYARLTSSPENPMVGFIQPLLRNPQLFPVLLLGLFGGLAILPLFFLRREHRLVLGIILAWAATALLSTLVQRKFFLYQYLPLLAVTSLFGGLIVVAIPMARPVLRRVLTGLAVLAALLLMLLSSYRDRFADARAIITGQRSLRAHWDSSLYHFENDFSLRDDLALADYVMAHSEPRQSVFIWGFEPLVYFVSQRPLVSRFSYNYPLVFRWQPERFRAELLEALVAHPPELFVVQHGDHLPRVMIHNDDSHRTFLAFAELRAWVHEQYRPQARVGRFDVYRRRVDPPGI